MVFIDPVLIMNSVTFASILSLLSLGITLSYMTTRVFNFAHTRFATLAAYAAATVMFAVAPRPQLTPQTMGGVVILVPMPWWWYLLGFVVATIVGGIIAVVQFFAVLRPLQARGADYLTLMISTLGFDFILLAFLFIYSTMSQVRGLAAASGLGTSPDRLTFSSYDIGISAGGIYYAGSFIEALIIAVAMVILLGIMLTKTKIGIMMRASIENPQLALVLGIDVNKVYALTWFLAGATAGIAGYLILFSTDTILSVYITPVTPSDNIIVSVFAGSIVGGVNSIFGSIGGGFLIGLVEQLLVPILATLVMFPDLTKYAKVFSMGAVALTLLFLPEGIASLGRTRWARSFMRIMGRRVEEVA
ncbi:MAG: branched-chain amino acid ABC transporter permease [Pyrodictiaceae archaeon]